MYKVKHDQLLYTGVEKMIGIGRLHKFRFIFLGHQQLSPCHRHQGGKNLWEIFFFGQFPKTAGDNGDMVTWPFLWYFHTFSWFFYIYYSFFKW